ncbi:hypothetical protein J1C51_22370 [Chromobacterium haemolyticum]|uniref:hypothetical protein n=1 Tax=Chromobacterium haemolyticum TaxID=394935 RepID=UPI001A921515|nr:hypothetical protein [Chromobacterium haemolyticum]MBO0501520.1 hypothetical protein [Chromobacterium haemolyticum]
MTTDHYWEHQAAALLEALLAPAITEFLKGKSTAEVAHAAGEGFTELAAASPASMQALIEAAKTRIQGGQVKLIHVIDYGARNARAMREMLEGLPAEQQERIAAAVLANATWSLNPFTKSH